MDRRLLIVLTVLGSLSDRTHGQAAADAEATPDGRFGTACYPWNIHGKNELCSVSFYGLIADPARYHGRAVKLSGYLVRVFGEPILFPNELSYKNGALTEGVELIRAPISTDMAKQLDNGISAVRVIGIFDAKHTGTDALPMLGSLEEVHLVEQLEFPPPHEP